MNIARALLIAVAAAVSGCVTGGGTGSIALPSIPAWQAPASGATVGAGDVAIGAMQYAPSAQLVMSDARFTPLNEAFARALVTWTRAFLWTMNKEGAGFAWTAESLDCDKFAKAFTLAVEIAASRAGVKAQPLALRISVNQREAFGGVPAMPPPADGHALVALVTDAGILVVEPQSGAIVPLAEYPNRAHVWRITIGG